MTDVKDEAEKTEPTVPSKDPNDAGAALVGFGTLYAQRGGNRPQRLVQIDADNLDLVLSRPPLGDYLKQLWERRFFIAADTRARVDASTRTNILGKLWLVLDPLMSAAVYFVVFGILLNSGGGIPNFIGYLVIGVFLFQFTTRCLTQGSRSITGGRQLIRSFSFPRAALPIATVARELLRFIPVLGTMFVIVLAIPWLIPALNPAGGPIESHITWRWALVPLIIGLQLAMSLGLALLAARLCAKIPDITQLIGIFCRFWLYASAVFFSADRFAAIPWMASIMQVNPMYIVLDMTRDCLLYGVTPSWTAWVLLGSWSGALLVIGMVVFWSGEESYGAA